MLVNLLRAEIWRMYHRMRTRLAVLGALLLGMLAPLLWAESARPRTAEEVAVLLENCGEGCTAERFKPPTFPEIIDGGIVPFFVMVTLLGMVVVIAYAASDISSGHVATQLTFTPRRGHLLVARTAACGLLSALVVAVVACVSLAMTVLCYAAWHGWSSIGAVPKAFDALIATILMGAIAGMAGTMLVFTFNGAVGASAFVALGVITGLQSDSQATTSGDVGGAGFLGRLSPTWNVDAFIEGTRPLNDTQVLSRPSATVYLVLALSIGMLLTLVVFTRRDIRS